MNRRGSILIMVLFVMTVLGLLSVSMAYRAAMEHRASRHAAIRTQLRQHALSAMAIAVARLERNTNDFDHPMEAWHTHPPLSEQPWCDQWQTGPDGQDPIFETRYYVRDEQSKLHVNYASGEALEQLGMSQDQIASLFNWMETRGADHAYYRGLNTPHYCKNAPIELLDEILDIQHMTPEQYWGKAPDSAAQAASDDPDDSPSLGWVDLLTSFGDGRLNINTVSQQVLETLPLSTGAARQIDLYRRFDAYSGDELDNYVFRTPTDIEQLQGLTDGDQSLLKSICVFKSSHFRINVTSRHNPTGATFSITAVVATDGDDLKVLQWRGDM